MPRSDNAHRRRYHAPARAAAAARTREKVLLSAKLTFEERGWAGATIPLIARRAGVAHQTVEALGTKAVLLEAVVDFAIRGDVGSVPMRLRDVVRAMEDAPGASPMLDLHAAQVRSVSERSAGTAWAVEHGASSDRRVARLWRRMTENRRFGVRWAAATLLTKPDAPPGCEQAYAENVFWLALDWGTYRTLTRDRGLDPDGFEGWLRRYYRQMFGA